MTASMPGRLCRREGGEGGREGRKEGRHGGRGRLVARTAATDAPAASATAKRLGAGSRERHPIPCAPQRAPKKGNPALPGLAAYQAPGGGAMAAEPVGGGGRGQEGRAWGRRISCDIPFEASHSVAVLAPHPRAKEGRRRRGQVKGGRGPRAAAAGGRRDGGARFFACYPLPPFLPAASCQLSRRRTRLGLPPGVHHGAAALADHLRRRGEVR
jgi:hypothetical protein